jgi:hypothetical protein
MSTVRYVAVMCDGCGKEAFHNPTSAQARAAARKAKWKLRRRAGDQDLCLRCRPAGGVALAEQGGGS